MAWVVRGTREDRVLQLLLEAVGAGCSRWAAGGERSHSATRSRDHRYARAGNGRRDVSTDSGARRSSLPRRAQIDQ